MRINRGYQLRPLVVVTSSDIVGTVAVKALPVILIETSREIRSGLLWLAVVDAVLHPNGVCIQAVLFSSSQDKVRVSMGIKHHERTFGPWARVTAKDWSLDLRRVGL